MAGLGTVLASRSGVTNNVTAVGQILAAVQDQADSLLFLVVGFDGVLVDYEADPQNIRLPLEICATLNAFANRGNVALGIMSGRRTENEKDGGHILDAERHRGCVSVQER